MLSKLLPTQLGWRRCALGLRSRIIRNYPKKLGDDRAGDLKIINWESVDYEPERGASWYVRSEP